MDPEQDVTDNKEDVDMITAPPAQTTPEPASPDTVQGETAAPVVEMRAELPLRIGKPPPHRLPTRGANLKSDIPPIEQQVKAIETLLQAFAETPVREGDSVYLVSRQWLDRAKPSSDAKHGIKELPGVGPGPVDNSDIIQTIFTDSNGEHCVKLKPGMGSENFELFPEAAWELLVSWYGIVAGQSPIVRVAHNTAPDMASPENVQFEFHPPVFTIHRLWSATSPIPIEQELKLKKPPPPVIVQSTFYGYHNFLKQAKQLTGVPMDRKVRVWRLLQTLPTTTEITVQPSGIGTPPDSPGRSPEVPSRVPVTPGAWPEMLVDVETFLKLERDVDRGLVQSDDTTTNPNYNGKKSLSLVGLNVDQTLVIDEEIEKNHHVSTFKGGNVKEKALATRGSSGSLAPPRTNTSGRNSPALSVPLTRGRAQKSGRALGSCGLQNLGNTCYMNSALQCVRSVEELTKYFLTHEYRHEINADNPLSHNGDVAAAYGRLLDEIYKDPPPSSVQPRHFKGIIGKYAPAFSGFGQQDSQEFLGFLLDGLQEDLNRIKKKPYIEKPDSTDDMINNPAAIREMAEKVWDITKKRDDSVIADLFTGMYKSTLVCPVCDKISITFDPFNNLTLPLPIGNMWNRQVKFFPLNDRPVELTVDIDKCASHAQLKEFISARVGVPVERLFGAEEFRDKFFKFYEDRSVASEDIQNNDNPTFHELEWVPTNACEPKKQAKKPVQRYRSLLADDTNDEETPVWEDPMAQRMIVPVIHRMNSDNWRKMRQRKTSDGPFLPPPHFIMLTPYEARNEDIIRRKILERVANFTTWSGFRNAAADDTDTTETTDPELVNNASDADSGDAKIVAKSVEGEEDIVDVTMGDADERKTPGPAPVAAQYPNLLKQFNKKRPKWVDPREFLDAQFQNLFELGYFSEPGSVLPTGWQSVQEDNPLPRLNSRQPKPVASDVEMRSPGPWDNSEESGSESSPGGQQTSIQTRMVDESSEEDSDPPKVKNVHPRPAGKGQVATRGKNKKMKPNRTYGKKGKKRFEKQQRAALAQQTSEVEIAPQDLTDPDDGPLIRLGEGIVVDWNEDAFDNVFGNEDKDKQADDVRGKKLFGNFEVLEDPGIEKKRELRQRRRTKGIALDDCLAEFEKEEILSEQDTWYCPRCKEHRRASKKFDLWRTPDILVVHLKRFSSTGWRRDKLDALVDFPIEGLDLTERVVSKEDGKQEIYDLIAVDNHYGGLGGGHYTAFAKNFLNGEWYDYNDAQVSPVKELAKIVSTGAYLLFYRRRSDVPLGGPKFADIFDRFDSQSNADDDMELDSGEGQRLGQGSSLRGSPSALTGADLTLPRASRGSASSITAADELPSYSEHAEMGTHLTWDGTGLRNSIEADDEDEAIDVGPRNFGGISQAIGPANWSFDVIKHGSDADVDDDIASDVAQGDGSPPEPFEDMEPMLLSESRETFMEASDLRGDDYSAFEDPSTTGSRPHAVGGWEHEIHTVDPDLNEQANEQATMSALSDTSGPVVNAVSDSLPRKRPSRSSLQADLSTIDGGSFCDSGRQKPTQKPRTYGRKKSEATWQRKNYYDLLWNQACQASEDDE
ncbi:hypothetical protein OQA88_7542 [Cercophora sp. LCS_1]